MEPTNNKNFTGMNVAKLQQERAIPTNTTPMGNNNNGSGNIGKIILALIIIAILGFGGYLGWDYLQKNKLTAVKTPTATSTKPVATISTTTSSINVDLEAAQNFDNSRELELIDREF